MSGSGSGSGIREASRTVSRRAVAWGAALVVSAVFCGFGGWSYAAADGDEELTFAQTRDRVLTAGRAHVARLSSADGTQPDAAVERWLDASTGALNEELRRTRAASEAKLRKAGTDARGTVTDAALTALDERAGTAELIATVRVQVKGAAAPERKRFEATLARTGDGWKVQSLTAVPLGGAS
ncbi:hypothetical protein [Streptomyces sp. NPDC050504]|uniref:hypothetical protein n=1 Tax=Streptomyces sp. NPDC050504 TaxID=3365618 RepID=UPI0037927838